MVGVQPPLSPSSHSGGSLSPAAHKARPPPWGSPGLPAQPMGAPFPAPSPGLASRPPRSTGWVLGPARAPCSALPASPPSSAPRLQQELPLPLTAAAGQPSWNHTTRAPSASAPHACDLRDPGSFPLALFRQVFLKTYHNIFIHSICRNDQFPNRTKNYGCFS